MMTWQVRWWGHVAVTWQEAMQAGDSSGDWTRGDVGGDCAGGDVTRQEAVSGMWRTAFRGWRFRREGLRESPALDTWRGYGGKTAELPDIKCRACQEWRCPPTVDLQGCGSDGWRRM